MRSRLVWLLCEPEPDPERRRGQAAAIALFCFAGGAVLLTLGALVGWVR